MSRLLCRVGLHLWVRNVEGQMSSCVVCLKTHPSQKGGPYDPEVARDV